MQAIQMVQLTGDVNAAKTAFNKFVHWK